MRQATIKGIASREQRRARIVRIATQVFFEAGYSAASLSMIAARLGGSKSTIYSYFQSKEDLFEAVITAQCRVIEDRADEITDKLEMFDALTRIEVSISEMIFTEYANRTLQLVVEESVRAPRLAFKFYEVSLKRAELYVIEFMAGANARGLISIPNPTRASNQFIALIRGTRHFKYMLGLIQRPAVTEILDDVKASVELFMCAYGP